MGEQKNPLDDDRLLRIEEVAALTGIAKSTLYQQMARGEFPRPIRVGPRFIRWPLSELRQFFATCPRYEPAAVDESAEA